MPVDPSLIHWPIDGERTGAKTALSLGVSVAVVVMSAFAMWMRLNSPGWTTILMTVPSLALLVINAAIILFSVRRASTPATAVMSVAVSLAIVFSIAMQRDHGDGSNAWLVYMAMFPGGEEKEIPAWWMQWRTFVTGLLFIAVPLTWLVILGKAMTHSQERSKEL